MRGSSPSGKTTDRVDFFARPITLRMTSRSSPSRASSAWTYSSWSIPIRATPLSIAAFATAGASHRRTRESNGEGIRYSGPKRIRSFP